MRALISVEHSQHHSSPNYLKRMSIFLLAMIGLLWIAMYMIVFSGAFNRAVWASMMSIDTITR